MRLITLLSFAALFVVTGTARADWIMPSDRVQEGISLRAGPSTHSTYLGQLRVGERLLYRSAVPYWYEVQLPNGHPAFVSKAWATLVTEVVPTPTSLGPFTLDAVDVGTGLAVVVQGPDFALLYDGGSNDDLVRGHDNRLLAFLRVAYPQLSRFNHIILSHPHRDHVELLADVIQAYKIDDVWDGGIVNDICGYRTFIDAVVARGAVYHTSLYNFGTHIISFPKTTGNCYGAPRAAKDVVKTYGSQIDEQPIVLGNQARMQFLYASAADHHNLNENSLVVRLDLGSHRVLLMGDAEAGSRVHWDTGVPTNTSIEGLLLACCTTQLHANVLVVGHHGSRTSSRQMFLDAVQASTFIISSGPKKYGSVTLPDPEVVTALMARGSVFRTDRDDDACATNSHKVGPDADNLPGGCDNVHVRIGSTITADYWHLTD